MNQSDIVRILVRRDRMDEVEAMHLVRETEQEIDAVLEQGGSLDEVEAIIYDTLGLEPDYLEAFL